MFLCFILSFLNSAVNWTVETLQSENKFMSANNINAIISGTTAIVRVRFGPWATNNTLHWLNWKLLVNLYVLKIRPRMWEIVQHFFIKRKLNRHFMPGTYILIECSLSRTFKWCDKDSLNHGTAFSNQVFFYGKNNTWRNPLDFLVKRVSVISIVIATAYDILRFSQ